MNSPEKSVSEIIADLEAKGITKEQIQTYLEQAQAEHEREAAGFASPAVSGSLEQEIEAEIRIDKDELLQKAETMEGVNNTGEDCSSGPSTRCLRLC